MEIGEEDPAVADVAALLALHRNDAHRHSSPGSGPALDVDALRAPGISFWTARDGGRLLGCGAMREIDAGHGEIKSMHVDRASRGRGVGAAILAHILETARSRGYRRVSLETGADATFAAARALYARFGFLPCPPFGGDREHRHSIFLSLDL